MTTETFTSGTHRIHKQDLSGSNVQITSDDQNRPTTLDLHNVTLGDVGVTIFNSDQFPLADINAKGMVNEVGTLGLGGGFEGVNFGSTLNLDLVNKPADFNLTGTIDDETFSRLNVTGKGTFSNNGTTNLIGGQATIDTNVDGNGQYNLNLGIDTFNSKLTMDGAVGAGQVINLNAGNHLLLSDTPQFLATVNMGVSPSPFGPGDITLEGIISTSSSYNGSVLDIFKGSTEVASLKITTQEMQGLLVTSSSGNTVITPSSSVPIMSSNDPVTGDHTMSPALMVVHS